VRQAVTVFSMLEMLLGTFWVTQGTGLVPCGAMAGDINWAYFGLGLFLLSIGMIAQVRP
jgi:hypothetical protein